LAAKYKYKKLTKKDQDGPKAAQLRASIALLEKTIDEDVKTYTDAIKKVFGDDCLLAVKASLRHVGAASLGEELYAQAVHTTQAWSTCPHADAWVSLGARTLPSRVPVLRLTFYFLCTLFSPQVTMAIVTWFWDHEGVEADQFFCSASHNFCYKITNGLACLFNPGYEHFTSRPNWQQLPEKSAAPTETNFGPIPLSTHLPKMSCSAEDGRLRKISYSTMNTRKTARAAAAGSSGRRI
jgi:hypothetical protein